VNFCLPPLILIPAGRRWVYSSAACYWPPASKWLILWNAIYSYLCLLRYRIFCFGFTGFVISLVSYGDVRLLGKKQEFPLDFHLNSRHRQG
jgi:hypothetical protein